MNINTQNLDKFLLTGYKEILEKIQWDENYDLLDISVKLRPNVKQSEQNKINEHVVEVFEKFQNKLNNDNTNTYFIEALREKNFPLVIWLAKRNPTQKCLLQQINEMKGCDDYKCIEDILNTLYREAIDKGLYRFDPGFEQNWKCMILLIKLGIDINYKKDNQLVIASQYDNEKLVQLLINVGADVNFKNRGTTSLSEASLYDNVKIVKLLINAGADVNFKDLSGSTALSLALLFNNNDVAKLLKESGAK